MLCYNLELELQLDEEWKAQFLLRRTFLRVLVAPRASQLAALRKQNGSARRSHLLCRRGATTRKPHFGYLTSQSWYLAPGNSLLSCCYTGRPALLLRWSPANSVTYTRHNEPSALPFGEDCVQNLIHRASFSRSRCVLHCWSWRIAAVEARGD